MAKASFPLWSDEPATRDLLSFDAVAATIVDAVLDDNLDPIALGLSGSWGSGKTSVLELVKSELLARADGEQSKVLVVSTQPWRYDPSVGPKESLIAEVLDALDAEIPDGAAEKTKGLIRKLVGRVKWAKAIKMAALTSITLQLPNVKDVLDLVSEEPGADGEEGGERGLGQFREDFGALLESDELKHVSRVVVLVDDLDRCLPETVIETLEAIRLFLSAKGMSFVIAADEDRVADAIEQRIKAPTPAGAEFEAPAKLYLHKIVQTTIPLPALSRFDTHAYLFLLLAENVVGKDAYNTLVAACSDLRIRGSTLDDLVLPDGADLADQLAVSSRLTPILYEKFRGNPRRIKRFLNDLNVRQSVAARRGITLPSDAVAKLMVLERLLRTDFDAVLGWLAKGQLRDRLDALDQAANQTAASEPVEAEELPTDEEVKKQPVAPAASTTEPPARKLEPPFSDSLVRWAKLPPKLDASEVSGYLYLAASFAGVELIDDGLPERLRDIASALTSSLRVDRSAITDNDLRALSAEDARSLIAHLGSRTRDQPTIQKYSVAGILRIVSMHSSIDDAAVTALRLLPPPEVHAGTPMLLKPHSPARYGAVLAAWDQESASPQTRRGIQSVRQAWSNPDGD